VGHQGGDIDCDVSDPVLVSAAIDKTIADHGSPDRLVVSAGVGAAVAAGPSRVAEGRRHQSDGIWLTMRGVARAMIEAGNGGSIVAVSSISGTIADRDMGAYCVSKAVVDMLVRVAAAEWGVQGIRVNQWARG
jgi:NAD(P)-dependent dehydrogenase (short-subunit alcohol dehydrogenase family)